MDERFKAESVARGSIYLLMMTALNYALASLFYMVLPRLLSKGEVGFLSFLMFSMLVFNALTLLALNAAVIKYVAEFAGRGENALASLAASKALKLILLASTPALVLAFAVVLTGKVFPLEAEQVYAVLCMIGAGFILDLTNYYGAVMFGLGMYSTVTVQNVIFSGSSRFLGLLLAYLGYGLVGVSVGFLTGALICLSYSVTALRGRLERPRGVFPYGKLLSYSLPLYVNGLIGLGLGWADLLVLQLMVGSLPLTGVYYLVTAGASALSVLWAPMASALFPAMSARHGSANPLELRWVLEASLRVISVLVIPVSAALASISPTAITIAYGEGYAVGALPFSMVSLMAVFAAYSSMFTTLLQSVGRTPQVAYVGGASLLVGTGLALTLAKPLSLIGVALSRMLTTLTAFLLGYRFARGVVKFRFDSYSVKRSLMVALCSASILLVADTLMRGQGLKPAYAALLDVTLFIALGMANLLAWKPLTLKDVEVIEKAIPLSLGKTFSLLRHCAKRVET